MTWLKVVGLFALLGWAGSWIMSGLKEGRSVRGVRAGGPAPLDLAALFAVFAGLVAALFSVLITNQRVPASLVWVPRGLGIAAAVLLVVWAETRLAGILRARGTKADQIVFVGLHLALALGFGTGILIQRLGGFANSSWFDGLIIGGRLGVTYMGLVVLARIVTLLVPEIRRVRARRLYAIAWQSWTEAFRRMWAPWVVLVVFAVILAFTSWFLQPPRPAELGRLYVGTLMLLCSLLVTVAIVILAPISLPNDIRQQTIFTVVSKPVRRLELIWGRMLGYMALVTVLLVMFAGVSLIYFSRMVGAAVRDADQKAVQAAQENKTEFARQFREQADQLRTRMSAREPVYGSLIFFDSRGIQRRQGIDVGMELPTRSFIEGATPSRAIWRFGPAIPNPKNPQQMLDRSLPIDQFLKPGTIEYVQNRMYELGDQVAMTRQATGSSADMKGTDLRKMAESGREAEEELKRLQTQLENLRRQETELRKQGKEGIAKANALHSPPIPMEMTFTVYRTTKGQVGEPVYAQIVVSNPRSDVAPHRDVLPVKEYYTNKRLVPARVLVGSNGLLSVEVKCTSVNQYLGMAEGDLFLLSSQGRFWANFVRGLGGVWLQAMVLTAIGVFAGTFLSWPVALLTTIFFFVAGNVGFVALQKFALAAELVGGGPFESLIRMLSHDNLMTELAPTTAVVVAKTFDSIVMPVMARLVYLVPNFSALDLSNTVAEGFAVTWGTLGYQVLLALAYALPFSIAGYFILRNREVAA
jgi:hypothetical protein